MSFRRVVVRKPRGLKSFPSPREETSKKKREREKKKKFLSRMAKCLGGSIS